jgi:glycosyltransferase involved in cell wall biosynthesis
MKIAFVTDSYVPAPNGTSVSVEILRKSLEKAGHDVYVFAPKYSNINPANKKIVLLPGVFSHQDKYKPRFWPTSSPNDKVIKQVGFDIIHSHLFYSPFKYALDFAKKAQIPHVTTFYRIFPEYERLFPSFSFSLSSNFERSHEQTINFANSVNHIVALSNNTKKYFTEANVNIPISVLPVGIFTKDYASYPPEAIKQRFKIPQSRKLLLTVLRLEKDSNLPLLLKAFRQVWKSIDDVHLLIVGGGSMEKEFIRTVENQAFKNFITFTGWLPKAQVNKIYGAADLFVYPKQLDPEPLCVIESLAAGTPVVAVEGMMGPDFIRENQDGFIAKPTVEDFSIKIVDILRRNKMLLDFSIRSRLLARDFKSSNLTLDLLKLYESTMGSDKNKFF